MDERQESLQSRPLAPDQISAASFVAQPAGHWHRCAGAVNSPLRPLGENCDSVATAGGVTFSDEQIDRLVMFLFVIVVAFSSAHRSKTAEAPEPSGKVATSPIPERALRIRKSSVLIVFLLAFAVAIWLAV
jgi:hypothetical protein